MLKSAIGIFVVTVLVFILFLPSFSKMQDIRQKNIEYEKEIRQLKIRNVRLLEEKRLLEEDPVYLEKVAREKMGVMREGEVLFRLTPAGEDQKK
ncbi:MAG TPA: hypothetical protein DD723_05600 [Candidatus Omnitrophica bacterium]|nr:MAG: hypothetical protein A2Z81_05450 [Omnitrophica WOR_2 bacterium GWA2_45_18]HBR15001.1 hypothetical protein [Candidatus Omnitrophota bacterium]